MAQINVNIRLDEETKNAFDAFCSEIGISMSTAFNIFAKTVVREQRIPFILTTKVPMVEIHSSLEGGYSMCESFLPDEEQSKTASNI